MKKKNGRRGSMCGTIQFTLDYSKAKSVDNVTPASIAGTVDNSRQVGDAIEEVNQAIEDMSDPKVVFQVADGINEGVSQGVQTVEGISKLWGPLLDNVSEFMKIVDKLADVNDFLTISI
jgi:hypothetical protein